MSHSTLSEPRSPSSRASPLGAVLSMGLVLCVLASCKTSNTDIEFNRAAPFDSYRTFAWSPTVSPFGDAFRVATRTDWPKTFERAIADALSERGLELVDTEDGDPDLLISYFGTADQQLAVEQINTRYERLGHRGDANWGRRSSVLRYQGYEEYDVRVNELGFLLIEMFDTDTGRLVWRGTARVDLRDQVLSADQSTRVRQGILELLDEFPPSS